MTARSALTRATRSERATDSNVVEPGAGRLFAGGPSKGGAHAAGRLAGSRTSDSSPLSYPKYVNIHDHYRLLAIAVIGRAMEDIAIPAQRSDVQRWLRTPDQVDFWARGADILSELVRDEAKRRFSALPARTRHLAA